MHTVYKITNTKNGKMYIGYTGQTIEQRWRRHCRDAFSGKYDYKFVRAIKKYGPESFIIETLEVVESKEMGLARECELIKEYNSRELGYNTHEGGRGGHTGAYHKNGRSGAANAMYGKHHTEETKAKAVATRKKWLQSEEGQKHLENARQRFINANPGKNKTAETIAKMSKSRKDKPNYKGRKVFVLTTPTGDTLILRGFYHILETYNLNRSCMVDTLYGRQSNHRGYKIRYATEEEIKSLPELPGDT